MLKKAFFALKFAFLDSIFDDFDFVSALSLFAFKRVTFSWVTVGLFRDLR